ncbi:MAG: N-acetylmuramoyl-L-alanine amidase [bacterium]
MKIKNHRFEGVDFVESPNTSGPYKENNPDTIIIHYTAGSSAASSIRTLTDPNIKASAHLVVARDGTITQLVPFNIISWHAGKSSYEGRVGFNKYSIGIEIDNAGLLDKNGSVYTSWFGRVYPESEVFAGVHRNQSTVKHWHRYSEEQITVVDDMCRVLVKEYNMRQILGHEEISPGRKVDPGPAFPLDKLRDRIFRASRDQDEDEIAGFPVDGTVAASKLNIRAKPDRSGKKVADALVRGKKVKVLEQDDDWYRVSTEIEGWVAKKFVDLEDEVAL